MNCCLDSSTPESDDEKNLTEKKKTTVLAHSTKLKHLSRYFMTKDRELSSVKCL